MVHWRRWHDLQRLLKTQSRQPTSVSGSERKPVSSQKVDAGISPSGDDIITGIAAAVVVTAVSYLLEGIMPPGDWKWAVIALVALLVMFHRAIRSLSWKARFMVLVVASLIATAIVAAMPNKADIAPLSAVIRRQNADGSLDIVVRNDGDKTAVLHEVHACNTPNWGILVVGPDGDREQIDKPARSDVAKGKYFRGRIRTAPFPIDLACENGDYRRLGITAIDGRLTIKPGDATDIRTEPYPDNWFFENHGSFISAGDDLCPIEIVADTVAFTIFHLCTLRTSTQ
jgi:hypothetical protein